TETLRWAIGLYAKHIMKGAAGYTKAEGKRVVKSRHVLMAMVAHDLSGIGDATKTVLNKAEELDADAD
ncbi:MAG: hypothetical protein ACOC80_10550, partial [Petrotogales bacterium]